MLEIELFREFEAALRVKKAEFNLLELHGGTGYLLAQFISPITKKRSDAYGGPIEDRIKFPLEVLKQVKDTVGDLPVGNRFLIDEWLRPVCLLLKPRDSWWEKWHPR